MNQKNVMTIYMNQKMYLTILYMNTKNVT